MTAAQIRMRHGLPDDCPTQSPWGSVNHCEKITDGILFVSTPSHGGYRLLVRHNNRIPEPFRRRDGWYEEDCDYAIVHFFLPEFFPADKVETARKTLRCWRWQNWEEHFKEEIPLADSFLKARYFWEQEHANSWLTVAAWGDWHETVPKGMVGVCAVKGGRFNPGREETFWLVSQEEYDTRTKNAGGSIVIDPSRHQPWTNPNA